MSISFIAALPPGQQASIEAELHELIATTPDLAGREEVSFPYLTHAYCVRRVSAGY